MGHISCAVLDTTRYSNMAGPPILAAPWRKFNEPNPWSKSVYDDLKKEICTHKLLKSAGIKYFNILLVGQISSGKSSFFNTVESVFEGFVTTRANAGMVEESLTTQYRTYKVTATDVNNKPIRFKFGDSMGLEGGNIGLSPADVGKIMDGHAFDGAELSSGSLKPGNPGYNDSPTLGDKIHCLAFVVDALGFKTLDDELIDKVKEIRKEANMRSLQPIVILTRIDQACEDVTAKDVTKVYNSSKIKEKVKEVSAGLGITEIMIYPVQNYSVQTECDQGIDILTLRALRQILRSSKSYLKDMQEKKAAEVRKAKMVLKAAGKKVEMDSDSDTDSSSEEEEKKKGKKHKSPK